MQVLRKATTLTDQESEPGNEEASRVLKFFMSTLLNGSMKQPKELELMRSLTTVCPLPSKPTYVPALLPSTNSNYFSQLPSLAGSPRNPARPSQLC